MLDDHSNTYNNGDVLAITIAPNDHLQHFYKQNRFSAFYNHYNEIFSRLDSKLFSWNFNIELSEPIGEKIDTKGPRLHLHGTFILKKKLSVYKWLLDIMPILLKDSLLSIKHIKDGDQYVGWVNYCLKQSTYMPTNIISNYHNNESFNQEIYDSFSCP